MQIKDAYSQMDADYEDVLSRMMNDRLIYRFNRQFFQNTDYENLVKALSEKDYETAFRMAHNLKGMCLNLGYKKLFEVSSALCEELRGGNPEGDLEKMLDDVTETYNKVLGGIERMDEPV